MVWYEKLWVSFVDVVKVFLVLAVAFAVIGTIFCGLQLVFPVRLAATLLFPIILFITLWLLFYLHEGSY